MTKTTLRPGGVLPRDTKMKFVLTPKAAEAKGECTVNCDEAVAWHWQFRRWDPPSSLTFSEGSLGVDGNVKLIAGASTPGLVGDEFSVSYFPPRIAEYPGAIDQNSNTLTTIILIPILNRCGKRIRINVELVSISSGEDIFNEGQSFSTSHGTISLFPGLTTNLPDSDPNSLPDVGVTGGDYGPAYNDPSVEATCQVQWETAGTGVVENEVWEDVGALLRLFITPGG